jgi:hypothetical protein
MNFIEVLSEDDAILLKSQSISTKIEFGQNNI